VSKLRPAQRSLSVAICLSQCVKHDEADHAVTIFSDDFRDTRSSLRHKPRQWFAPRHYNEVGKSVSGHFVACRSRNLPDSHF
jgi:hypothetical protein